MSNGKGTARGAPTYDRIGIDKETAEPSQPQDQQRVVAALRLGWELEELVARSYLLGEPSLRRTLRKIPGTPQDEPEDSASQAEQETNAVTPSLFVPDLFHSQSEQARLQSVVTIVRAQPALMFPGTYPAADNAAAMPGAATTMQPSDQRAAPAKALMAPLASAVDTLVAATQTADPGALATPESKLKLRTRVAEIARAIDQAIINILLDPTYSGETGSAVDPAASLLLSGYELGKALSGTRWLLWAAHMLNARHDPDPPPKASNVAPAWSRMFDSSRITTTQRQLANLTPVYGGRVTMAVTKSLDYWRAALLDPAILSLEPPSAKTTAHAPRTEWAHGVWTRSEAEVALNLTDADLDQEIVLFAALCQQVDAWYDLLTLRRKPEDFPITGLISNLLRQVAAQELKSAAALIAPYLRGGLIVIFILVVAVVVGMALAFTLLPSGTSEQVTAGGVLALGSGVLGSVAAFLTRRSTAAPRPAALSADVEQRLAQLETRLQQTATSLQNQVRAVEEVAPTEAQPILNRIDATLQPFTTQQFSWQNIVHTAATDAVNQLRLEEIYLGVSEPLVRYVLGSEARDGAAIQDPHAAARRFLDLIYESTPNIERLSGVLMDLYRAGTGSAPTSPPAKSPAGP